MHTDEPKAVSLVYASEHRGQPRGSEAWHLVFPLAEEVQKFCSVVCKLYDLLMKTELTVNKRPLHQPQPQQQS